MAIRPAVAIKPLAETDRAWTSALLHSDWGGPTMISRGQVYDCTTLPGFIAWHGTQRAGVLLYHAHDGARGCEVILLHGVIAGIGAGSALLAAVEDMARADQIARVWLITSNDNLHALGFYQRRGYRLVAVYAGAVDAARAIKPGIPLIGMNNIPLYDEIELQKILH